ncbi:hypothetical protein Tco_0900728 [Tanacetum coccineum]
MPEPIQKPDITKMTIEQFTKHLSKTTSFIFSPSPLREPTPPKDESKGKGITAEEPLKDIIPFTEEGGLVPKIPSFKSFVIPEGQLTNKDVMDQGKEMKRLVDLKVEKEKSKKSLQKIMNLATIRAQAWKIAVYEAKRKKMLDEYNHQIYHRVDQLLITKICYRVNSFKEASMRIIRGNDPLNLTVYDKFRLKTVGFSEWLNVYALASKSKGKSNDLLLQSLNAKFQRVLTQAKKLGSVSNIVVDGMQRNLIPPPSIEGSKGRVIRESESGIFYYNGNFDLVLQREKEFHLATIAQLIRLHGAIQRGTPEAEEMFKKIEMTIEAINDVNQARKIIQDNLDDLGQDM